MSCSNCGLASQHTIKGMNVTGTTGNNPFHRDQVVRKVDMTGFSKKDSINSANINVSDITQRRDISVETDKSALNLVVGGHKLADSIHQENTPDTLVASPLNYPYPLREDSFENSI